jgi:predicted GNAT family N-acyltransferase
MSNPKNIITLRCNGNAQIAEEVYKMRYDIYAKELSCSDDSIDHSKEICKDALDEIAHIFLIQENDEIISSIRFVMLSDLIPRSNIAHEIYSFLALSIFEPLFKDKTYVASRLAVKPTRRGSLAAIRLIENAYLEGLKEGVKFLLAYCEPSLIDMYLQLGLRIYGDALIDLDAHLTPLVLVMNDWDYLKKIKSPLYRAAQRDGLSDIDDNSVPWFYQEFGREIENREAIFDIKQTSKALLIDAQAPVTHNHSPRIIDGLSENECNIILSFCRIVTCKKGSILIKSGMVTYEMFFVIKGSISVYATNKELKSFQIGPGQVFGEIEMLLQTPRSDDCVAEEDSEIAILPRQVLDKISKVQPVIANKLLINIARTLSFRLYKLK